MGGNSSVNPVKLSGKIIVPSFSKMESGVGYTVLEKPLQILNMVYPSPDFDGGQKNIKLYGLGGLNRTMNYDKETKRN